MNLEYFIAKRIIAAKSYKSSISAPIIKIGITAIALGVITMLIALATGTGLQEKIREKISAFNGHVLISNFDNNQSEISLNPISKDCDFYPEFNSVEGISHIQAVAKKAGIVRTEKSFEGINFKGVDLFYNWNYFQNFLLEGRVPKVERQLNAEVLVSKYLVDRLELKLGDKMNTYFLKDDPNKKPNLRVLKIVGIYDSGFLEFDKQIVLGDIRHIQKMNKWEADQIGNFEVFIDDFSRIDELGVAIYDNTPNSFNEKGEPITLDVKTINKKYNTIFQWLDMFDFNISFIIGIMILVGGINMITALLVLILERTQMIGILKALGGENASVRKIFLINAGYLILKGLFWGNLIGLGLLTAQEKWKLFPLNPETYYVTEAPVNLDITHILLINLGTFILCFLMLLIPSYVISKISPVKAIRFE